MEFEFEFDYEPGTIRYGSDCVSTLGEAMDGIGFERAPVVTGRTVGATDAVMDLIRAGLGERLVSTFAETTPDKTLSTALEGVERLHETAADVVVGTILPQYGCSRVDGLTLSLIHAFGHRIARWYDIQQGGAHAIIAPHALAHLFDEVDGKRALLAEGFGIETDDPDEAAERIVDAVSGIGDALGLPSRLREIDDMDESDLPSVAADVHGDGLMAYCPSGLDPAAEELEGVLSRAW